MTNDDFPMTEQCPVCGGPGEFVGCFDTKETFRCKDCGVVFDDTTNIEGDDDAND